MSGTASLGAWPAAGYRKAGLLGGVAGAGVGVAALLCHVAGAVVLSAAALLACVPASVEAAGRQVSAPPVTATSLAGTRLADASSMARPQSGVVSGMKHQSEHRRARLGLVEAAPRLPYPVRWLCRWCAGEGGWSTRHKMARRSRAARKKPKCWTRWMRWSG